MKKSVICAIVIMTLFASSFAYAGEGGFAPCLASCLIGPRVGLEMNEGKQIETSEWIMLGGQVIGAAPVIGQIAAVGTRAYNAYVMGAQKNGFEGALASFFLGSRVGNELDTRKIRTKEWLQLIPCVCIYPLITIPLEAYNGKTMSEIEAKEGLRK